MCSLDISVWFRRVSFRQNIFGGPRGEGIWINDGLVVVGMLYGMQGSLSKMMSGE